MRSVTLFLAVMFACLIVAAEKKEQAPRKDAFARTVKVLQFGELNPYFEPSKADAAVALGLLGGERAVPVLIEQLDNEKNPNLRFQIVKALGWIKSPKAVAVLEKAVKDEDMHVRKGAAMALKAITGKEYKVEDPAANDLEALTAELLRFQEGQRRPDSDKPSLEVGKTYCFSFGRAQRGDLVGKILAAPTGDWVKVQIRKGDKPVISWINLSMVAMITGEKDEK